MLFLTHYTLVSLVSLFYMDRAFVTLLSTFTAFRIFATILLTLGFSTRALDVFDSGRLQPHSLPPPLVHMFDRNTLWAQTLERAS